MKISVIQHVEFEGPGAIAIWAMNRNIEVEISFAYDPSNSDPLANSSALIVMGGPMGVRDEQKIPWMKSELQLIERAILSKIPVLGICLGAQIIAKVLGAKVYPGPHREIGWFPLEYHRDRCAGTAFAPVASNSKYRQVPAFHWHGDTFDLPVGASLLASSEAYPNQAFVFGNSVYGIQYHWEVLDDGLRKLVENCRSDIISESNFVQSAAQIVEPPQNPRECQGPLFAFLDAWLIPDSK